MRKSRIAIIAAVATALALAGSALAGKQQSSLSLVVLSSGDFSAATVAPSLGDQITFDVATNQTDRPFVQVDCYQNGTWVYDAWHGFFDSYVPDPVYTLSSPYWTGGGADCTARLVEWTRNGTDRTLASTSFTVTG